MTMYFLPKKISYSRAAIEKRDAQREEVKQKTPTVYIQPDIEPYISPTTGELISSRKAHREDLKRSGCRVYEGREQETKEAARVRAEQDRRAESKISEAVEKTFYDLKYNRTPPARRATFTWE